MAGPWLDPLLVVDRRARFEHRTDDVAAARDFIGPLDAPDDERLAAAIVSRVHERLRVLPSAFGFGTPRTLSAIVASGGGNCVSYAVLTAVLLRDRGIPARLLVEDVYTDLSLLRAPAALLPVPIGPTLNGHVWNEVLVGGEWVPADAELDAFGIAAWFAARLEGGATIAALGIPVRERWQFPLRIRRLAADGSPVEDVTALYLIERLATVLGADAMHPIWLEGVRYFSESFCWEGRAGLRLLREGRRLRRMSHALSTMAEGLAGRVSRPRRPVVGGEHE